MELAERDFPHNPRTLPTCRTLTESIFAIAMKDYQQILFPYAYNILGLAEDARDAIQDVLTKYYSDDREGIANEKAYLIKSVINHSINLKTRRKRIVQPEGWLPEPV